MQTSSFRHVIVAMTIAVSAATVHGAWFSTTDALETAPIITVSTWDYYEKSWTSSTIDLATPQTVRHSEDTIVAITGATSLTLPGALNVLTLDGQSGRPSLASLEIPTVNADAGTRYFQLLVSRPTNYTTIGWPSTLDPENPWSGPIDPTEADLSALDVEGSVGVHEVDVIGSKFTWDIGRWSKGDIFLGLNNHTYKVLDRHGNFKRFVASADYDEYHNDAKDDDYNVTTGCATNWKTGEVFATNFADYYPAINVIGRQAVDGDLSPYSQASRRILTRINRTDDALTQYANAYTSVNYPIDSSPESVAFDADMNLYVGHSFGNFRQAPAAWRGNSSRIFEYDDEWTEYTTAVDGLPQEGWSWDESWGWLVDETGVRLSLAPAGSAVGAFAPRVYGVGMSPRLSYDANGALLMATARNIYPAVVGLPDWNPAGQLPLSYMSDPATGTALHRLDSRGRILRSEITPRWSMGKRLHRYAPQNGQYVGSEGGEANARRDALWTFTGRQGTDWIDLDVTGTVMYYTSEDSFIHRYRVKPGPNGEPVGQLPDVGANLTVNGVRTNGKLAVAQNEQLALSQGGGLLGNYRFHGMRILPPGDGTGGFLVAVENGLGVHRFNADGKWVQRYSTHVDHDRNPATDKKLVFDWYTLEVDPGGRTFWASAHDNGWVVQFDIASGRVLKEIEAVNYVPAEDPAMPAGRRVEGICIMWEYTAPQEICSVNGQPEGQDNDGDGYVDENCVAIEVCSAISPGDDDGDGLADQYDSDCSAEMPPVAIDDAYRMNQQDPAQTTLTVGPANGVIKLGPLADYDRDSGAYADASALTVVRFGVSETSLSAVPGASITTGGGGTVVLQANGSFVYTPNPAFHGVDSFAYQISDGYPATGDPRTVPPGDTDNDIATVRITVAPKVANDGTFNVWVGESLSMGGLLTNDPAQNAAPSAGPVTITEAGPSGAPVAFTGSTTFQTSRSNTVTVNTDGSFLFVSSNLAYSGLDDFTYAGYDGVSRSWNIATVTVNVIRPTVTVTVPDQTKIYDGTPLPTTCTVTSNFADGPFEYTLTYLGTTVGGAPYASSTAPTNAGTYTATCVYLDPTLGARSDTGTITVQPRPLVAKANDKTIALGSALPTLDGTLTGGVVAGDVINVSYASTNAGLVAGVFPGVIVPTVTAGGTTLLTNYTVTKVPGTLTVVSAPPCRFRTQTQGGWGSSPSGNNPGTFLAANWSRIGTVVIGTGTSARTFTSARQVEDYLPTGGSNILSGQVLALTLSVRFSDAGVTSTGLGALKVKSGPMAGYTVAQVLALANSAIATGSAGGFKKSTLNDVVDAINNNFVDGTSDRGYLALGACAKP